ncbi:MAG: hypothetical protein V1777_00295 [Candidatus Micrarchaeota archaeon]
MPKKQTVSAKNRQRARQTIRRRQALQYSKFSSKLAGLGLLKRVLVQNPGIRLLPYRIVRKPETFSLATFHPLPERVLVRSDEANSRGSYSWDIMPRRTFYVNKRNPKETENEIRAFMTEYFGYTRNLFYIVHPLRALQEYHTIGKVYRDGAKVKIEIKEAKKSFKQVPISISLFRNAFGNHQGATEVKSIHSQKKGLTKKVDQLAQTLARLGGKKFEFSFVTYKDSPNQPEIYDLLLLK